jgi:hypothetical protein
VVWRNFSNLVAEDWSQHITIGPLPDYGPGERPHLLRAELESSHGGDPATSGSGQVAEGDASQGTSIDAMRSEMTRLAQQNEEIKQESKETKELLQKLLGNMEVLMQK